MTRQLKARDGEEIWETTTAGRVWIQATDERGRERPVSVGGKIGARLRISTLDREIAQDRAGEGESDSDPFTCGLLVRVDADQQAEPATASPDALTTEALVVGFTKNGMAFRAFVDRLNEVNCRRMAAMASEVDASVAQVNYLAETIRARWRIEGDTPTYREMQQDRDVATG